MRTLLIVVLFLAACTAPFPFISPLPPANGTIPPTRETYLPVILTLSCQSSMEGANIAGALTTDSRQERVVMRCNPALTRAAENRAKNLADNAYFAHCDLTGKCANQYAREAGCRLPDYYTKNGNNIESLVAGPADWLIAYRALSNSPAHAEHLFGRLPFFREQMDYGIASIHQEGSLYGHYYVYLIAICE
jgi:hypothetical protein